MGSDNLITPLCKIGYKYGTDKTPLIKHAYTPYYYKLLKDKRKVFKKVLELGIGHYRGMQQNETIYDPGLKRTYHRGASLYMWRDFFPNAQIYGADIRPETMIEDTRIKTFVCDEKKKEDLVKLIEATGSDIDLFIDDASHHVDAQIFVCKNLMPLLNKNVIYIIEDVGRASQIRQALESDYNCDVPNISKTLDRQELVVVTNKL